MAARILKLTATHLLAAFTGVLAAGVLAYAWWVLGSPQLELWHTERLEEEFEASDVERVSTFEEYLRLESRLFAQMDEQVYRRVATGPEFRLVRYSAGSAADPRGRSANWNRSFELPAQAPRGGVLLLHGLSDSPYSLRAIGQALHARGYWVVGLRLPGHGTIPSALKYAKVDDFIAATRLGAEHLAAKVGGPIHIVGYSTGAALGIDYALRLAEGEPLPPLASLVLISPAIGISRAAAVARWIGWLAVVPGLEKLAWTDVLPEFDPYKYNSFTVNAAWRMLDLTRSLARRVETAAASGALDGFPPTLVFLSTVDATVSADAVVDNLLEHLPAPSHELVLFDVNRNQVAGPALVSDPGPLTLRLMNDANLPFALTLIGNESVDSLAVVSRRKPAFSDAPAIQPLGLSWPEQVLSLSHVALPFPPDDPVYGLPEHRDPSSVHLGRISVQGERGLLAFPEAWLLRLRHNPFYDYLEGRLIDWIAAGP